MTPKNLYSLSPDLIFTIHSNGLAEFQLNRPKAQNALSLDMIKEMTRLLHLIEPLSNVNLVLFWSQNPRVFCAGGDVAVLNQIKMESLRNHPTIEIPLDSILSPLTDVDEQHDQPLESGHDSGSENNNNNNKNNRSLPLIAGLEPFLLQSLPTMRPLYDFFHLEYSLLSLISTYSKPTLSLISGTILGGGVGLAMSTTARITTLNTNLAMPEAKIGLFPDVGASFWFSRTSHSYPIGRFLGCIGYRLHSSELLRLNLIDGIIPDSHYFLTYSVLKAIPGNVLSQLFHSPQLPQILIQYSTSVNVLHHDSLFLLKQQQKYQLQLLFLLISTYVSTQRQPNQPPSRLSIYMTPTPCLAINGNDQSIYSQLHHDIHHYLQDSSFLFMNLPTILSIFNEPSYYLCVERINALSSATNHASVPISATTEKETQCAKKLQSMLKIMSTASCVLTYQLFSPIFSNIVSHHKAALQSIQTKQETNIRHKSPHFNHQRINPKLTEIDNNYSIYHSYLLQSSSSLNSQVAHTPLVLNRFIKPIHFQHYRSFIKHNPITLTTPSSQHNYIHLSYQDYLNTEFILVVHGSIGDFGNMNFMTGVNSLLKKHNKPKFHSFMDIISSNQYLLNDLYPLEMMHQQHLLLSSSDEVKLFNEQCYLLLYSMPISHHPLDLSSIYRYSDDNSSNNTKAVAKL
jgi:enoyl-CoA hydratase/carnithine racemase